MQNIVSTSYPVDKLSLNGIDKALTKPNGLYNPKLGHRVSKCTRIKHSLLREIRLDAELFSDAMFSLSNTSTIITDQKLRSLLAENLALRSIFRAQ